MNATWKPRLRLFMSARGRPRVWVLSALGTVFCIVVAFTVDSFDVRTQTWALGPRPLNNLIIPCLLAPPFFFYLLSKLRELAIAHHDLFILASVDSLTGCLNRRSFTASVEAILQSTARASTARPGALLVIDADHFKQVNDFYGHAFGDEALVIISDAIRKSIRETDLIGRVGGEEFGVFLPVMQSNAAEAIAERIRAAVEQSIFTPRGETVRLSVSIGVATFGETKPFAELFRRADENLYLAKRNGRNRVEARAEVGEAAKASASEPRALAG